MAQHPFADLTAAEIIEARDLIQAQHPRTILSFKAITLDEPDKKLMKQFLEAEHAGQKAPAPDRIAYCPYYLRGTTTFFAAHVNLTTKKVERSSNTGVHGNADFGEVLEVEKAVMEAPEVKAEIAKLNLPSHLEVIPEPWIFGSDGVNDLNRQYQVYMFVREKGKLDSNHYARPLPFSAVFNPTEMKLVSVEHMPTGADHTTKEHGAYKEIPPNDYTPESVQLRTDLKRLNVVQPDGPSYTISSDRVLRWQKWELRLGFTYREALVLRDVRYDGKPLFYRVSLSEMTVPYGDPRSPYHRKMAFDLGDVGAGMVANDLKLGCDCLGVITYLDGLVCDRDGTPVVKENAVCIHEQDNGIGWKHTNYRTENAFVVRNRELVLQSILTVSNYEYILMFILNQAGELEYQVRATGILSTSAVDEGVNVDFGTVVHPGVLAAHHQHILSLRIDPALGSYEDGQSLIAQESYAMPIDEYNPHGTGYRAVRNTITKEGGYDLDSAKGRTYMIQNGHMPNAVNGLPASYKVVFPPMQPLLAHSSSFNAKRAEFADHHIYVTKYRPDELFSGGKYTNQSRGGAGIKSWIATNNADVEDEDIVVWVQFGLNHIPRIEDFPVMPVEIVSVHLKPVNFFTRNPALDVPQSTQAHNRSIEHKVGTDTNGISKL
ncbi:copper amine oxidase [Hypoxylon trugodes]|uniref:copper amine oxidase n=1 Tax=Hypoxylon trugodes TaxID=326681 RepID=UPI0021991ED8|nr:copper amine oxidase [Hypoxylon trugodes]KAI1390612.1 copper amine oxidase [Hypoxylon trugodes]